MTHKRTVLLALTTTHHGLYRGVARYAREHNWHLVPDMLYATTIPYGWEGDGIISHVGYWEELADFIRDAPQPRVELTNVRADIDAPHVKADNRKIGLLAAEHFLDRSYRNFAWAPFTDDAINADRFDGFRERLADAGFQCHGLPPQHHLTNGHLLTNWSANQQAVLGKLKDLPKPLAIFCYNDCVAANILHLCQENEIRVPEQVAIMGSDNDILLCESLNVPLSSVIHDLEGIGYKGAELLDRLIDGEDPPDEPASVAPRGIVARQSTDMIAVDSVEVAKALRYIWENYQSSFLCTDDIVEATNLSRRPLEIVFRKQLGHTIHDEVINTRLDRTKKLLSHSDKKVAEIANEVGFTRPPQLYRKFRDYMGCTPSEYRAQMRSKNLHLPKQ